jgi:hypothetical protein
MLWLDAATVVLDAEAEAARDYAGSGRTPRRGAFRLAAPYGCRSGSAAAPAAPPPLLEPPAGAEQPDDAGQQASAVADASGARKRKRKRRGGGAGAGGGGDDGGAAAQLRATREAEAQRCVRDAWRSKLVSRRFSADAHVRHACFPLACAAAALTHVHATPSFQPPRGAAAVAGARAGAVRRTYRGAPAGAAAAAVGR